MSRTLTAGQQATPDHLEWLAQIGALHGATTPGIVVAGQVYDLEIAHINMTNSLTMLAQGATPSATMSVFGATPQPGDSIAIWSLHGDLTEPLIHSKGRVEQVREVAGGWAEITCTQDAVVTEIPRAHINGNAMHVMVGQAEMEPMWIYDSPISRSDAPSDWGINDAFVSGDAVMGDIFRADALPGSPIEYAAVPDTYSAVKRFEKLHSATVTPFTPTPQVGVTFWDDLASAVSMAVAGVDNSSIYGFGSLPTEVGKPSAIDIIVSSFAYTASGSIITSSFTSGYNGGLPLVSYTPHYANIYLCGLSGTMSAHDTGGNYYVSNTDQALSSGTYAADRTDATAYSYYWRGPGFGAQTIFQNVGVDANGVMVGKMVGDSTQHLYAVQATAGVLHTSTTVKFWGASSDGASAGFKVKLYTDNAGAIGALIGISAEVTTTITTVSELTATISGAIPAATTYWVVIVVNSNPALQNAVLGIDAGASDTTITYEIAALWGMSAQSFDLVVSAEAQNSAEAKIATKFGVVSSFVVQKIGAYIGGGAPYKLDLYQDDGTGAPLDPPFQSFTGVAPGTVALVEHALTYVLDPGDYHIETHLNYESQATTGTLGVDNGSGDTAHSTQMDSMQVLNTLTPASFDAGFKITPRVGSVEWFHNGVSLGTQQWNTSIVSSTGDIRVLGSQQFGFPASGESASFTVRKMKMAISSQWGDVQCAVTGFKVPNGSNSTRVFPTALSPVVATIPVGTLATTYGPTFSPTVTAVCSSIKIYNTTDRHTLGNRSVQIRENAVTGVTSVIVGSGEVIAEQVTANRWLTVILNNPVVLHSGETYWLTVSQDAIVTGTNSGSAMALQVTESDEVFDGVSVRVAELTASAAPMAVQAMSRLGSVTQNQPNDIRAWLLSLTGTQADSTSYTDLTSRYASDGLVLGGLLQANTVSQALAEIDRHTRTLSTIVGDTHYLIDGDATASANIAADEALQVNRASSSYGAVMTRVAYSYKQGSGSGTVIDSAREGVYPLRSASLSLNLLPDATNAAATAAWRLSLLGINRRVAPILIADMATTAGDVVAVAGQLLRVDRISMGAAQIIEAEAVEI